MFHDSSKYIKLQRAAKMLSPSIFTFQKCNTRQTKNGKTIILPLFTMLSVFVYMHVNVHQKTSTNDVGYTRCNSQFTKMCLGTDNSTYNSFFFEGY